MTDRRVARTGKWITVGEASDSSKKSAASSGSKECLMKGRWREKTRSRTHLVHPSLPDSILSSSIIAKFGVVEACGSGPMKKATISESRQVGLFMDTWHIFDG